MGDIAQAKQLGRIFDPVVFITEEGPDPGAVAERVNADTPIPPLVGVKPTAVLVMAGGMILVGYLILRKLLD